MKPETITSPRREFLKTGLNLAAGIAGTALLGNTVASAATAKTITLGNNSIPTRPFGKTGHVLPILGHGGSAMIQQFIGAYGTELIPLEERIAMVRKGYDSGMRYFDTARVYGESESIMGKALKDVRENCFIASKVAVYSPDKVRQSVETTLKNLDTSYVDAMQIHSPSIERIGFEGGMKIHAELLKLRDEGMVRFIGCTTHVIFDVVHQMISTGGFDQVLLAYGYFRRGMVSVLSNRSIEWRQMCLSKAHELGMAIVAMKIMGADVFSHAATNLLPEYDAAKRAKLPGAAIRWVASDPRVSMLNVGVSKPSDIDENLATIKGDLAVTNEDRNLLAEFAGQAYETDKFKKMLVT